MQIGVSSHAGSMPYQAPLLKRFAAKILIDVMPAALASFLVGCLLSQYQFGRAAAPKAVAPQSAAASAEMIQFVRDEHSAMMDYLRAEAAAENSRNAAQDSAYAQARAAALAKASDDNTAALPPARSLTVASAAQPATTHPKARTATAAAVATVAAVVRPPQVPFAIAQSQLYDSAAPDEVAVRRPVSLLSKTVHATLHVVSEIGGIPNWFASLGDRIGGGAGASADGPQAGASS